MPLLPGKKNVGHNIKVEKKAGKPIDQATAIALHEAHIKPVNGGEVKAESMINWPLIDFVE
jgi:hypothetical protein